MIVVHFRSWQIWQEPCYYYESSHFHCEQRFAATTDDDVSRRHARVPSRAHSAVGSWSFGQLLSVQEYDIGGQKVTHEWTWKATHPPGWRACGLVGVFQKRQLQRSPTGARPPSCPSTRHVLPSLMFKNPTYYLLTYSAHRPLTPTVAHTGTAIKRILCQTELSRHL